MHLEHFGLPQEPFGMTPDPAYLYASRTHAEALESLTQSIQDTRGFVALIAEPGMGKTTLLYRLSEQLRDTTRVVHLSQTQCSSRELIEYILQDLGVNASGMGLVTMHVQLNEILFEEMLAGKRFVLIVDEAQNLDDTVLETVRMLSNFETHNAKLIQIILAGQPALADRLAEPHLAQLRQRIAALNRLEPFFPAETAAYIEHRLRVAGYQGEGLFDPFAVKAIARLSRGIPRLINNLCYTAMREAYARGLSQVTPEAVEAAVRRLSFEPVGPATANDEVKAPLDQMAPETAAIEHELTPPEFAVEPVADVPEGLPQVAEPDAIPAFAHFEVFSEAAPVPNEVTPSAEAEPAGDEIAAAAAAGAGANAGGSGHSFLTYDQSGEEASNEAGTNWGKSGLIAIVLFSAVFLLAMLGRSASRRDVGLDSSAARAHDGAVGAGHAAEGAYDAAPLDTAEGQVLTVAANSGQSLQELCRRYIGELDPAMERKIRALNPDLRDPARLEAGQLIRLPLPAGSMKKANDTADGDAPASSFSGGRLLSKLTSLLQ